MKFLEKKLDGTYIRTLYTVLKNQGRSTLQNCSYTATYALLLQTIQVKQAHWAFRVKKGQTHKQCFPMDTSVLSHQLRNYIYQICSDTGCHLEDLSRAMRERDGWRDRVRGINAISWTWWWWLNFLLIKITVILICMFILQIF